MKSAIPLAMALLVFGGCKEKVSTISDQKYASVYARSCLISEHFKNSPDSAGKYTAALYKFEGVAPADMEAFVKEKGGNPEDWEKTQQMVIEELRKLNPTLPQERKNPLPKTGS